VIPELEGISMGIEYALLVVGIVVGFIVGYLTRWAIREGVHEKEMRRIERDLRCALENVHGDEIEEMDQCLRARAAPRKA